jgi:RNA polymerase sigma factor (sigma-70 family)
LTAIPLDNFFKLFFDAGQPVQGNLRHKGKALAGMSNDPRTEDARLAEECSRNNQHSQKNLYEKYYRRMLGVCLRYCRSDEDAKDVLHDGFMKVFRSIKNYNSNNSLEGWIRKIMVNTAIDKYRQEIQRPFTVTIDVAGEIEADAVSALSELSHKEILSSIEKLPSGYRLIFNMYVIEGYTHKEIAELLKITEGTSKSQLHKARTMLQQMITKTAPNEQLRA